MSKSRYWQVQQQCTMWWQYAAAQGEYGEYMQPTTEYATYNSDDDIDINKHIICTICRTET